MKSAPTKKLQPSNETINAICSQIRQETLLPAEQEAERIVSEAHAEAKRIVHAAEAEKRRLIEEAAIENRKQKNIFDSSLEQSAKQALEALRHKIVDQLFATTLYELIHEKASKVDVAAKLIEAVITSLEKEGLEGNVDVYVGRALDPKEVAKVLGEKVSAKISGQSVQVGSFDSGIEVRQKEKKLTVDITKKALISLLSDYLKNPEFRKIIFREES